MKRLIILFITSLPLLVTTLVSGPGVDENTKAINQSPEDMKFKFYILRGKAYGDQGNFDEAIRDFGISIQMHPSYDGYLNRGQMYFQKIELTGGASRYRPKGDISKYRVWANSKGYAFTKKSGDEQSGK